MPQDAFTPVSAAEKLAMIERALAAGATVYLTTYTRATKITPKTAAKFAAAGHPVVKLSNGHLMLASGRNYVCADYCGIEVDG